MSLLKLWLGENLSTNKISNNNYQKIYWNILSQKKLGFPYVTLCLALSCLVITLPILFSAKYYDTFALWSEDPQPWQYITYQFCHGEPGGNNLWPHFLTNLSFFILFGGVIERLIGSGRFFCLSLALFSTNLIRTAFLSNSVSNGASSICWGYLVFVIPILIRIWRKSKGSAFRDAAFVLATIIAVLGLFGLPIIIWVSDHSIINNTNTIHLLSILTAVPFFFMRRKVLFNHLNKVVKNDPSIDQYIFSTADRIAVYLCFLPLVFNVVVLVGAIAGLIA